MVISIVCVAAALLILTFALLSVFVFVPMTHKEKYLEEIDAGIDKYMELDYFNIRHSTETDGEEDRNPRILQGYLDENGNAVYYNSVTDEIVKDGELTYKSKMGHHNYEQPESIRSVSDLLKELLTTWGGEDDFDLDINVVTYIRRSGSTYHLKFSDEYLLGDMTATEKKNIEITETITGRVEMDGEITKSIEVSVRYRNTKENEDFSIDSKIEFLQTKPEIGHGAYSGQFLESMNAVSLRPTIDDSVQELLKWDSSKVHCENGYVFSYSTTEVCLYDPVTLSVQKTFSRSSFDSIVSATVYGGFVWCEYAKFNFYSSYELYQFDLQTGTAQYKLSLDSSGAFNDKYFYSYDGCVYDLEQEATVKEYGSKLIYVDREGLAYGHQSGGKLFIYDPFLELEGTEVVKEKNGFIYTQSRSGNSTVLYEYSAGVLQRTINLSSDKTVLAGDYYFVAESNKLYDKNGNVTVSISAAELNTGAESKETFSSVKILAVCNGLVFVRFERSSENRGGYFGFYRMGEWDAPVAYTDAVSANSARVFESGNYTYLALYSDSSRYSLADVLLLRT